MVTVVGVVFSTRYLGGKAGKYFMGQQKSLGAVNGYIEEMVNGQKVVKVFNHEQVCKDEFDKLNDIYNFSEVNAVYLISGGFDLMVMLEGKTLQEVAMFVSDKLTSSVTSVLVWCRYRYSRTCRGA